MEHVHVTLRNAGKVLGDERPFNGGDQAFDARIRVYADGSLAAWNSVAGHFSARLADELTDEQRAEVARLAAREWAIPDDLRRTIHDSPAG